MLLKRIETPGVGLLVVRGDVEPWIASQQFTTQPGFRADTALIGTLGDRIVLDQVRWFGKPDGDAFEFERVRLLEVGTDGLLRAVLFFDPEDRSAASVEGLARFAAGEAAGSAGIPLGAELRPPLVRSSTGGRLEGTLTASRATVDVGLGHGVGGHGPPGYSPARSA